MCLIMNEVELMNTAKKKRKEKKVYGIWRMGSEANFNKTQGLNIDNKVLPLFADDINAFEK